MIRILSFILISSMLAATTAQLPHFLKSQDIRLRSERIVGGENAPEGSTPHQVSLRSGFNSHFCGGSIINERWILTAGHCLDGASARAISVVAGSNQLNRGGHRYEVESLIIHEDYDSGTISNDIGLLKVKSAILFNDRVQPIRLPSRDTTSDADLILTGWGRLSYPGVIPNNLQILNLRSLSFADCKSRHSSINPVYQSQLCTLTREGQGACHGDSGGPLTENSTLVGLVSWGMPCARGYPDVHTRVYHFLDWIQENLRSSRYFDSFEENLL